MTLSHKSSTRWLRLLTVLAPVLLLWGIPEVIVRLADPVLQQYRAIYFGNDTNSPALFIQDPALYWKLRPHVSLQFRGVKVQTNMDGCRASDFATNCRNILCIGDSTTFGWGVEGPECFTSILEKLLNESAGTNTHWQVINAGVPGYSSYQMRLAATELISRWQPEVVIVCAGNNDSWPAAQSDRAIGESQRWMIRFQNIMSYSRFAIWLREAVNPQSPRPFIAESLTGASPRVSTADFTNNIRQLITGANEKRAQVIVMEPPVNLYKPPFVSRKLPDLDLWADWCRDVYRLANNGKADEAIDAAEAQLRTTPRNVYALWLKGYAMTAAGRIREGREYLELALECHPFPEGCRRTYREFLSKVAGEQGCGYLSVNQLLLAEEIKQGPMGRMYLDPCHPTPEGHKLIAYALKDMIKGQQ